MDHFRDSNANFVETYVDGSIKAEFQNMFSAPSGNACPNVVGGLDEPWEFLKWTGRSDLIPADWFK